LARSLAANAMVVVINALERPVAADEWEAVVSMNISSARCYLAQGKHSSASSFCDVARRYWSMAVAKLPSFEGQRPHVLWELLNAELDLVFP
jgi:hypothetical protein